MPHIYVALSSSKTNGFNIFTEFYKNFIKDGGPDTSITSKFPFSEQISKLTAGLELISNELKNQVRDQHGALLSQASHAGRLDNSLNCVDVHMKTLMDGATRLTKQVHGPYAALEQQTVVLTRLHDASHLMRQVGTFLHLYKNLQQTKDFSKQATIFYEMEALTEDKDLQSIKFIREEIVTVQAARKKIITLADKELHQGLKTEKQDTVLNAVHILSNLGILETFFNDRLETFVLDVKQAIKECFTAPETKVPGAGGMAQVDVGSSNRTKGPGKAPNLTTNLNFRNKLWLAFEWLFNEEIHDYSQQIRFLHKCLVNSSFVSTDFDLERRWWNKLEVVLSDALGKSAPPHIGQCLQQGLPKLTAITKNMVQKLGLEEGSVFR